MDEHVKSFFTKYSDLQPDGKFHQVITLDEAPDVDWATLSNLAPSLSRGWYELSRLPIKDRIEFTRDFWLSTLPYQCGCSEFFLRFFDKIDDIGIYITQKKFDDPYEVCMIYDLKDKTSFYRGGVPATEEEITALQVLFPNYILPEDYKAFLRIHNGFWKTTDCTGITPSTNMRRLYDSFKAVISKQDILLTMDGKEVNPASLIPFYESFGMPFYQCFWGEWYPAGEMGNVYYSEESKTINFYSGMKPGAEKLAFSTFLAWLSFYLEPVV